MLIHNEWNSFYSNIEVEHLAISGSNHTPMLVRCSDSNQNFIRYFKFLKFWADHLGFFEMVQQAWEVNFDGNSMWKLQQKLKLVAKQLSSWSKIHIGDVYTQVKE